MARHVAFLRAINTGRRRVKNVELCAAFEGLGLQNVSGFLASGNVLFESPEPPAHSLEARIAAALEARLGYPVPTFLRSPGAVRELASTVAFSDAASDGSLQIVFLRTHPASVVHRATLAFATEDDRLRIEGRELFWLPKGSIADSGLNIATLEGILGPITIRTHNTIMRLAAEFV